MNILVSACLMGLPCRYDGKSKPNPKVLALGAKHTLIPVCPEQMGGLPTPRPPAEWQDGSIVNKDGVDVTEAYLRGADQAAYLATFSGCRCAVLKERSPACSCREIYDGTFTDKLIPGWGSAAWAVASEGILVLGESELDRLPEE